MIFLVIGITAMRENKEKTVTSGDEDVATPPLVQMASVQVGKRKSKPIFSVVDLDDLPSRRGLKKKKSALRRKSRVRLPFPRSPSLYLQQ